MRRFFLAGIAIVLLAACAPSLGERPALPTAIPGVSSSDIVFETPEPKGAKTPTPSGPTSTPAPWATELPPTPLPPPPQVGHVLAGHENCLECHTIDSFYSIPKDHVRRSAATCLGCHAVPEGGQAPRLVHAVPGREACLTCHLQGKNGAPAEPGDHAGRLNDSCLNCHQPK